MGKCIKCENLISAAYHKKEKDNPDYKLKNTTRSKKNYYKDKEAHLIRLKNYSQSERGKRLAKEYRQKHKAKIKSQSRIRNRKYKRNQIENITPVYVKSFNPYLAESKDLLQAKIMVLKLKRLIRNKTNGGGG